MPTLTMYDAGISVLNVPNFKDGSGEAREEPEMDGFRRFLKGREEEGKGEWRGGRGGSYRVRGH